MDRRIFAGLFAAWMLTQSALAQSTTSPASSPQEISGTDNRLEAAKKYVESSDRYLYHTKLHRGMKGYGLTVLAGTKVVRFDVEILSVMTKWGPHQDVIIARLSGQNLESTGIIAGMSGSPVYVRDETDGKDKLVGAVAYGWSTQKEPVCGIQPIVQMIAAAGVPGQTPPAKDSSSAAPAGAGAEASPKFLAWALNPHKIDFAVAPSPSREASPASSADSLAPLATPLMVSGLHGSTLAKASRMLEPLGMFPVQAGGMASTTEAATDAAATSLVPGGGIAVPLTAGDSDLSAVGTVTDVQDGRVLAFGHAFFAQGELELPMGSAYVHTIISSIVRSFKLASPLKELGSLDRDETTAISGVIGKKTSMVPMTVTVNWPEDNRTQVYRYRVCRHPIFTPMLAEILLSEAVQGWRDFPEYHTIRHTATVDFGPLGKYRAENVSSDQGAVPSLSDAIRPVAVMLSNPLGPVPRIEGIDVSVTVEKGSVAAEVLDLRLDGRIYKPGETVTGTAYVRPFRKERTTVPVSFKLPDNLPDGTYSLTACDADVSLEQLQQEQPQQFQPRSVEQLFATVQRVVEPRMNRLYLRLPLNRTGVALGQAAMPKIPESRARVIVSSGRLDTVTISDTLVESVETNYVLSGSAKADFQVQAHPVKTLLRK
jgi:hypothetical protein